MSTNINIKVEGIDPGPHLPENLTSYPAVREVSTDQEGNIYGVLQDGLLIREHGQYEGGRWPYQGIKKARLMKWDKNGRLLFAVGRQTKDPAESNSGKFYYPMHVCQGPNQTIIVGDQIYQPANVWTQDGLFAGTFLDHRANDNLPSGVYKAIGDDLQNLHVVQLKDGCVFWFGPACGQVPVYEITGWDKMCRTNGIIRRPATVKAAKCQGRGLSYQCYQGPNDAEPISKGQQPVKFSWDKDSAEMNLRDGPFRIVWDGFIEAPMTESYKLSVIMGKADEATLSLEGQPPTALSNDSAIEVMLSAGKLHQIRIAFKGGNRSSNLRLFWYSTNLDKESIPICYLYTAR
ncbi:MAG: hypothetical protein GWN67_11420 [Phycisphaerae bacterium]|nr:hypothetical protein [Phycisphaerae bacterium]NIU09288.1 hypothetical protein [Phycisphaerae bacterium]NIU56960.1 hypothetical protein [Phycisphaerae bacterium]NIW93406.1 hypothetical protein [Phycisphaerae bacterium]NIW98984.1 hypothetical protein [Phycisphaerae bacterium]